MSLEKKEKIQSESRKYPDLSLFKQLFLYGWPEFNKKYPGNFRMYYNLTQDNTIVKDLLVLLDDKLIVPMSLRNFMSGLIHESHRGIEKCKTSVRQVVYWPSMSKQIYEYVLKCRVFEQC